MSPRSIYATPTCETFGGLWLIHATPHSWKTYSRPIGSPPAAPGILGDEAQQFQPFVPARSSLGLPPALSGQAITLAFLAIDAGPALIASSSLEWGAAAGAAA